MMYLHRGPHRGPLDFEQENSLFILSQWVLNGTIQHTMPYHALLHCDVNIHLT